MGSAVRSTERGGDVVIILIVAKRAAAEWLLIFSNVMKKSVHTLISFVFRPAKAHRAFAGRSHGGAARDAHHHGVVCARGELRFLPLWAKTVTAGGVAPCAAGTVTEGVQVDG